MLTRLHAAMLCIASMMLASGCGGSDVPLSTDAGPIKLYEGRFRQNQLISVISFSGGLTYGFYQEDLSQPQLPEFAYAGFLKASGDSSDSEAARTGRDYRFDSREEVAISLVDFSTTEQSLSTVIQSAQGAERVFASRALVDELPTNATALGGDYTVQARSTSDSQKGTASISSSGNLQVDLPGGCRVTGFLKSRPTGNLYDAGATFAASCTVASRSLSGHAFQSYATRNTYILLTAEPAGGTILLLVPVSTP